MDGDRNPDGTYNGVKTFATLTGLSEAEIAWTFDRLRYLLQVEGKSPDEAKAIVAEETQQRPWETRP